MNHEPAPLRLAFAGTPPFAVAAFNALAATRHEIRGVFTQADRPAGRGRMPQRSAVKVRAAELGIPVHQPASFQSPEAAALLHSLAVDAFVVVAYGLILPAPVLAVPALGCFNIHASLLPRWRGAAPIQRAILAGDRTTGVSIMRMAAGLDTGSVLLRRAVEITAHDTAQTLHDRLAVLGGELICAALEQVARGAAVDEPQADQGATYAAKIDKSEALIDWSMDADAIVRKVRAFNPRPVAETRWGGVQLRIWDAEAAAPPAAGGAPPGTVLGVADGGIEVACGLGIVRIKRLQLPGRKPQEAREFAHAEPLAGASLRSP